MSRSAKILKLVQPTLPGSVLCRDVLVLVPTGYILRGFFLNTTPQKHHMDLWKVVMPLHRPRDSLVLTYGDILAGPDNMRVKVDDVRRAAEVVEQCVRNEVGPLCALQTPSHFLRHIAWRSGNESEVVQLDLALAHFLVGNVTEALAKLRLLIARDDIFPIYRSMVQQALAALDDGPAALQTLIDGWRDANVAAFGLAPSVRGGPDLKVVSFE